MWVLRTWRARLARLFRTRPTDQRSAQRRTAHLRTGRRGERIAARELRRRGYEVLTRNWRTRAGEVDLVAREGAVVVLVEVRSSSRLSHAGLLQRIDARKRKQLTRVLAHARRMGLGNHAPLRVDAVFVDLRTAHPVVLVRRNVLGQPMRR